MQQHHSVNCTVLPERAGLRQLSLAPPSGGLWAGELGSESCCGKVPNPLEPQLPLARCDDAWGFAAGVKGIHEGAVL